MPEAISFWLDNKMASAKIIAEINGQVLVDYRGKFYVIINGMAVMKGSKPLHYSKSSMPLLWKKAMRGEMPSIMPPEPDAGILPRASITKRVRMKKEKETSPMPDTTASPLPQATALKESADPKPQKSVKKAEAKPALQTVVPAHCPYCNQKHDIPAEKGKNGKPFFVTCTRCTTEFAVRFVPVTMFQAQVAGFR